MILLTPGPTPVPEPVVRAMTAPIVPHRGPEFTALLARVRPGLGEVFRTRGPVLAFAGSGTLAMESAIWSLAQPGDLTCSVACGRFGERWGETLDRFAEIHGGERRRVHSRWGRATDPDRLASALDGRVRLVTVVQSETSVGGWTDLREVGAVVREHAPQALLVADVVTGLGAMELEPDAWGVDACVAASQKALMLPPGLGFVSLGERAIERLRGAESVAPRSIDLRWRLDAFEAGTVANTPPVALWYGLEASLEMILAEDLEARWDRVRRLAQACRDTLVGLGFRLAAEQPSPSVTAAFFPDGRGDEVREACRERGVVFAGGQDQWKGRVLRMSHMGAVDEAMTETALRVLSEVLSRASGA